MEKLRNLLGFQTSASHPMSDEQVAVAERLRRIERRQVAIDIQAEVLAADRRDMRRPR